MPLSGPLPLKNNSFRFNRTSLRICYVLSGLGLGGTEVQVVRLAEGLKRRGHQTEILCLFEEGQLGPLVREKKIPLVCLNVKKEWGPRVLFRVFQELRRFPRDVVHTYLFGFHLFAGLPARLLRVPVVLSSRRDVDLSQTKKILWFEKAGNFFVDKVVCNSEAVRKWVLGRENLSRDRLRVIYNGVDLSEFRSGSGSRKVRRELGIPDDVPVIGTVANFSFKKGYGYLLETAERVCAKHSKAWFLLVGFGPLEEEMKRKAAAGDHAQRIVFAGERQDIPSVLEAMDLFVFASLWEGFPNVVLEAMAMGKPVISTPVGGVPEIIRMGEEGLLVPLRNPEAMAQAILSLLEDPAKARRMGEKARKKIEKEFSLERMIDEYEAFYFSLLQRRGGVDSGLNREPQISRVKEPLLQD